MAIRVGRCLLRKHLKERGMTQQYLADKLDMPRSQISHYSTNRRTMTIETAKAIANVLKCNIDDLYEWIEVPARSRHKE